MPVRRVNGVSCLKALSNDCLLGMRMRDLKLSLRGTSLADRVAQLNTELAAKGLRFKPHCWLSDDWYSPDGIPGIAIPFYLAHPRLRRLERAQMYEVEGGTRDWCMRLLRHEAGHAIDTAYRLRRRRGYRDHFGRVSKPYPKHYQPRPLSKSYVLNLGSWYAQSHPVEDFAETFAVWLQPRSGWRKKYASWEALRKLEYVDELMQEIGQRKPIVGSRERIDALPTLNKTLGEHYRKKRMRYGLHQSDDAYVDGLLQIFSNSNDHTFPLAATFLDRNRRELCQASSGTAGSDPYTVDQVLNEMIWRCRELGLRLRKNESSSKRHALGLLKAQTISYLEDGFHRVAM